MLFFLSLIKVFCCIILVLAAPLSYEKFTKISRLILDIPAIRTKIVACNGHFYLCCLILSNENHLI